MRRHNRARDSRQRWLEAVRTSCSALRLYTVFFIGAHFVECGDVIGPHGMNGGPDQGSVDILQVRLTMEHDIGGVPYGCQAPVITLVNLLQNGTVSSGEAICWALPQSAASANALSSSWESICFRLAEVLRSDVVDFESCGGTLHNDTVVAGPLNRTTNHELLTYVRAPEQREHLPSLKYRWRLHCLPRRSRAQ